MAYFIDHATLGITEDWYILQDVYFYFCIILPLPLFLSHFLPLSLSPPIHPSSAQL